MNLNLQQIIITGDIFRPNKFGNAGQDININWLYHMLCYPLNLATGLPVKKYLFSKHPESLTKFAYDEIGEEISTEAWGKLYYFQDFTEQFLQKIWLTFRDSLIVSFELPEILRYAFQRLGIFYIDIVIHPARFLDDVIFGIRSNCKAIQSNLDYYQISQEYIHLNAGYVMATMSRLKRLPIQGKTAIFAGQTGDDKVLIKDGKFLNIGHFQEDFYEIVKKYDTVILKPHPYNKNAFDVISMSRIFENCVVYQENFYYILSHDNVEAVYSITSSTSIEAKYFDKIGYHLGEYPFKFVGLTGAKNDFSDGDIFIPIDDAILSTDFWRNILQDTTSVTKFSGVQIPNKPNRIRKSLRNFWGFNFVDTDIICELYQKR